jgi:hypothetical protein
MQRLPVGGPRGVGGSWRGCWDWGIEIWGVISLEIRDHEAIEMWNEFGAFEGKGSAVL